MTIGIASDHRGYNVKEMLKGRLSEYDIIDYGTDSEEPADFPDYAKKLGTGLLANEVELGIAICGTGIGMSIAANKVKGIRAARCVNTDDAFFARNHNDSNVLCISSNNDINNIYEIVDTFLNTKTSEEERHHKRVQKIINYENGEYNEL